MGAKWPGRSQSRTGVGLTGLLSRVLAFTASGCAIPAVLLATAASASASGWARQRAAKPASKDSILTAVSCTSRKACVAVGYFNNMSRRSTPEVERWNGARALVERWNGVRWSIQPNPAGSRPSVLNGVSCTSATACTAVGSAPPFVVAGGVGAPLVERWDGSSWSIEATKVFAFGPGFGGGLFGVSCASRAFCAAVGDWGFPESSLLGRWNGRAWSWFTFGPGHSGGTTSPAVSCVSATACEGVGEWNVASSGEPTEPATWHWNGKGWSEFDFSFQSAESQATFTAVSCPARYTCVEVGSGVPSAMSVDGSAWSPTPAVSPAGAVSYGLTGVSCVSGTSCAAGGSYSTAYGPPYKNYALVEGWNGSSWTIKLTGTPGELSGVSCVSANACTAVGATTNSPGDTVPMIESTFSHVAKGSTQARLAHDALRHGPRARAGRSNAAHGLGACGSHDGCAARRDVPHDCVGVVTATRSNSTGLLQ
jgi:hypothetical protein